MRIAMVGPFGLHPNKTMESRALGLARPLVAQGHQVSIFMPPWHTPEEADKSWLVDGVAMRYVALNGGTVGIVRRLVQETLAWQPDVVHCFKPKAYSGLAAAWLYQTRRQLPLVMDSDDWEGWGGWNDLAPYSTVQKHFFAWQERWGMRRNHLLTVASRALQSLAWGQGIAPERVVYLPNGAGINVTGTDGLTTDQTAKLDAIKRRLGNRPTLLLYSRLFEFETGRLVAILERVKTAVPDLAILSIGSGLYEEDAQAFRTQLGSLQDAFVDVGWVDLALLPALLQCATVGIYLMEDNLLNRTKCPVKLADMVAVGLPVVGEAVGQVREYVVQGQTGLLYKTGDIAGLVAGLTALLTQEKQQAAFGEAAQAHYAASFAWDRLSQRLLSRYELLVDVNGSTNGR